MNFVAQIKEKVSNSIALKTATIFGGFIIVALLILFSYLYVTEKKTLKDSLIDKGKFLSTIFSPISTRAMELGDDISLINNIQALVEQQDIIHAMILNPQGVVIAHNKPTELGKVYEDSLSKRAVGVDMFMVFSYKYEENKKLFVYEFATPLISKGQKIGVLRFAVTSRMVSEALDRRLDFFSIIFILLVLLSVIIAYFYGLSLSTPLVLARENLEDVEKETALLEIKSVERKDEIGQVLSTVYKIAEKMLDKRSDHAAELKLYQLKFKTYIESLGPIFPAGAILMDSNNSILYINDTAAKTIFTETSEAKGKHILEVARNTEFASLFKQALKEPNQIFTRDLKNVDKKVSIISILGPDKMPLGTIVVVI